METVFLGMNKAGEEVLEWLQNQENIEVKTVIENQENLQKIRELRPEIVISSGFEYKVPKDIIEVPERGIVNLHPSFLPYNRGAHPYIWPIIEDTPAGVSVHFMNENIDEGPVIARKKVEKKPGDTAYTLRERLMGEQAKLFIESWDKILRGEAFSQDLESGSVHLRRDLDDVSELDLEEEMNLSEALNLLRGLTYDGEKLGTFVEDGERFSVGLKIEKE